MIRIFSRSPVPVVEPVGVAHVAFSLRTGGMERLLVEFARRADQRRFRLHFFCLTDRGRPADDIEASDWPVHCLSKPPGFRWSAVRRMAAGLREHGIHVVHTHNTGAMIYGILAAKLAGIRAVIHTGHGQSLGTSCRQRWAFAVASRCYDRVVSVSQDVAQQFLRQGAPSARVRTIQNGIDLNRFGFFGSCPGGPAVLVARLAPEKDLPTLLQAVALLVHRQPAFRLQVAGDGPCMQETQQAIQQLGLGEHVQLLGECSDIPGLLRRASLFVLSSRTEGIPLTLLEAMACGLPVVATRVGGNVEVVQDGQTGWLVPSGDAPQLAAAIERVWSDPEASRRLGQAGRERVVQRFDVQRMIQSYEDLYREVLEERGLQIRSTWRDESASVPGALSSEHPEIQPGDANPSSRVWLDRE
jgi:sugar transferase (PEP-CTERM/EpsH1 system associated)